MSRTVSTINELTFESTQQTMEICQKKPTLEMTSIRALNSLNAPKIVHHGISMAVHYFIYNLPIQNPLKIMLYRLLNLTTLLIRRNRSKY